MKRFVLPILLITLCLAVSGCGGGAVRDAYEELSHRLEVNDALSFCAALRCEYPERTCSFTVDYKRSPEGAAVTVAAPESIAGVRALVEKDGTAIEYEGVRLDVGELNDYGLSPMSALPVLVDALQNGHLDGWWQEDGKTVLLLVRDDHISATVWLESSTMTPMRAELVSDAVVVVYCDISEWKIG